MGSGAGRVEDQNVFRDTEIRGHAMYMISGHLIGATKSYSLISSQKTYYHIAVSHPMNVES
jgi:hypothetical protein